MVTRIFGEKDNGESWSFNYPSGQLTSKWFISEDQGQRREEVVPIGCWYKTLDECLLGKTMQFVL